VPPSDASQVVVYPNPYRADQKSQAQVTFGRVPQQATIRLYTLDGVLVRVLSKNQPQPTLTWDLRNEQGSPVASGVYLYIVEAGGAEKRGKVVLLR